MGRGSGAKRLGAGGNKSSAVKAFEQRIKAAQSVDEVEDIMYDAENDTTLTNAEYTQIYAMGLRKVQGWQPTANNPQMTMLVNTLNSAPGFLRLTTQDRSSASITLSTAANVGDSFSISGLGTITKTSKHSWQDGNISLTSSEVVGMLIDAVNMGHKIKFKSK